MRGVGSGASRLATRVALAAAARSGRVSQRVPSRSKAKAWMVMVFSAGFEVLVGVGIRLQDESC